MLIYDSKYAIIRRGIWERRPGVNRIFYFYFRHNKIVLLHQFRKKTNKTPQSEIAQAKRKRDDFLKRNGEF